MFQNRASHAPLEVASVLATLHDARRMNRAANALDPTDRAIVEHLQRDGRMPYTRLGAAVGLSEAAVRQRVQRLVDAGVMQVVAVTDPMQVGFFYSSVLSTALPQPSKRWATSTTWSSQPVRST